MSEIQKHPLIEGVSYERKSYFLIFILDTETRNLRYLEADLAQFD